MAIAAHSRPTITAIDVALGRPVHIICDYEIEAAVVVVIEPCRARGPSARVSDSRSRGHIREGSVTVVAIKNAATISADEQVGKSVVVIVADRYAHAEQAFGTDSSFERHIRETAVAVFRGGGSRKGWAGFEGGGPGLFHKL